MNLWLLGQEWGRRQWGNLGSTWTLGKSAILTEGRKIPAVKEQGVRSLMFSSQVLEKLDEIHPSLDLISLSEDSSVWQSQASMKSLHFEMSAHSRFSIYIWKLEGWALYAKPRAVNGRHRYVYLWLIHVDVWQKSTKFYRAVIFN